MFDSISKLAGDFVGNFADKLLDMAPGLVTGLLSTAANSVLPGSGMLVQAIAGPIVDAGFDAVESIARDALLPAASDALNGADFGDSGEFLKSLASSFLEGVQSGFGG